MAQNSDIEWTDATWNPLAGCTEISPGCQNCYAAVMAHRLEAMGQAKYAGTTRKAASGKVVWTGKVNLDPKALAEPLKRRKPTRYFVNSMSDIFHKDVPDHFIAAIFGVMAACKHHTFQVLTKRADAMLGAVRLLENDIDICGLTCGYLDSIGFERGCGSAFEPDSWPLPNVWLGVSVENQDCASKRIPLLLQTPAAVRFLSCEPLLGLIDFTDGPGAPDESTMGDWSVLGLGIDWVIVGGESGPGARPMHPDWARSLRDQCQAAGVSFFFKQWGEWKPCSDNVDRHYPGGSPGIGDTNQEYNFALRRMIKHHKGTRLVDDQPEGWQPCEIANGMGINGGAEDQLFLVNAGKKAAGRLLDGRLWEEFPEVSAHA